MIRFLQRISGHEKVNKEIVFLLLISGLYSLSIALSNTFVNIYLWKHSGDFKDIAFYNLAVVVMQPLTFILAGKWAKKIDRIIVLRLGVIFLSLFYLTVLLSGEHASSFLLLLGGFLGIGYGFYWLAFNVLTFEITEPETRDFFNGFFGVLTSLTGMIGPILAGWIISSLKGLSGYTVIFSISLGLFFGAVLLSMLLKRRPAHGTYSFWRIMKEQKNNQNWQNVLHASFFQGLREGSVLFVISIWVYITTNSEMALGAFGFVNSTVAFVFYFLATKFIKPEHRLKAILLGGVMLYLATILIIFDLTFQRFMIYAVLIAIAYPTLLVPYMSIIYDVIGKSWKAAEMRIEYIVVREVYLNAGRITSILLFITFVSIFNEERGIPMVLAIVGAGYSVIYFFVRNIQIYDPGRQSRFNKTYSPLSKRRLADEDGGSTV
ncbi:MFS transporter [Calidifontibacillus erzurumensis]|uniref:MFS transporter n=1 Tax=Calidifontibacillus erzurumensis TaxID=2741433 RepID=UPI0035B541AC